MGITSCSPWAATVKLAQKGRQPWEWLWLWLLTELQPKEGWSHWKLIARRTPFLAFLVHNQYTVWPGGCWFAAYHITVPHETVVFSGCVVPGVACHPEEWLASAEDAALWLSCCSQAVAWQFTRRDFLPINPPLAAFHKFVDSLLGLRIWVTSEAELHLLCFFAWD